MGKLKGLDKKYTKDRKLIVGKNDLLTWCMENKAIGQDIITEWNTKKNGSMQEYKPGSGKKVFFTCKICGEEYEKILQNRVLGGIHNPCGRKIGKENLIRFNQGRNIKKKNTLAIQNSELLNEWDYIRNSKIGLYPQYISANSILKAHWICSKCGNHYIKRIKQRTQNGWGCLKCNPPAVGRRRKISSDQKKDI